jgi:hypothetical protein
MISSSCAVVLSKSNVGYGGEIRQSRDSWSYVRDSRHRLVRRQPIEQQEQSVGTLCRVTVTRAHSFNTMIIKRINIHPFIS